MSYWDMHGEWRRLFENFSPMDKHLRLYKDLQEQIRLAQNISFPAHELLEQFEATRKLVAERLDCTETVKALEAAIQPLPDVRDLFPSTGLEGIWESIERVSRAIEGATFLAELDIPTVEGSSEEKDEDLVSRAEELLMESEEAEDLEKLRHIKFAPLVLLDKALGDPRLMYMLDARDFEGFVAELIDQLGFEDVVLTPRSGDEGRDVLATKTVHGLSIICAFECKRYAPDRPVGPETARALLGTITHARTRATKGILVTTSSFSPAARKFIVTEPNLDGKDFSGIVGWLREYGARTRGTRICRH